MKTKSKLTIAIIACLLLCTVIFCGCNNKEGQQKERVIDTSEKKHSTIIIDSCEYLQYYTTLKYAFSYTFSEYQAKFLIHKGNCKFCRERSKK